MTDIRQAKWDVSCDVDFERFSSGEQLTFVKTIHDSTDLSDGFKFSVYGLLDSQGRFHMLGHETELPKERQA